MVLVRLGAILINDHISSPGVFAEPLYQMLQKDGAIEFMDFANAIGIISKGNLNSRLAMLLRMFGKPLGATVLF